MKQQLKSTPYFKVADRVWGMKDVFVNFYMIQSTENDNWFLVDAGLKTSFHKIKKMAEALFGDKKPAAIFNVLPISYRPFQFGNTCNSLA